MGGSFVSGGIDPFTLLALLSLQHLPILFSCIYMPGFLHARFLDCRIDMVRAP